MTKVLFWIRNYIIVSLTYPINFHGPPCQGGREGPMSKLNFEAFIWFCCTPITRAMIHSTRMKFSFLKSEIFNHDGMEVWLVWLFDCFQRLGSILHDRIRSKALITFRRQSQGTRCSTCSTRVWKARQQKLTCPATTLLFSFVGIQRLISRLKAYIFCPLIYVRIDYLIYLLESHFCDLNFVSF